jgi:transposase InsO family protein
VGGKWYVLVVVDDYSRYAWVFFLEEKGETFGFVRDLVLRIKNERHGDAIRAIRSDNGQNLETLVLKPFAMTWVLNTSFRVCIHLPEWRGGKEK